MVAVHRSTMKTTISLRVRDRLSSVEMPVCSMTMSEDISWPAAMNWAETQTRCL